jgi:NADPH:quinone reductase-like Zn-dependent oxidoreductase
MLVDDFLPAYDVSDAVATVARWPKRDLPGQTPDLLAEVIALAQAGRIRAHVEQFPLADVHQAYDSLRAGRLTGRAVVIPGTRAA